MSKWMVFWIRRKKAQKTQEEWGRMGGADF